MPHSISAKKRVRQNEARHEANRQVKSRIRTVRRAFLKAVESGDLAFTRISNFVSVRSDTYSVYGTVQFIDPRPNPVRVVKTRRFWALLDRSPSAAYPPTNAILFLQPRIMNFQWLD